MKVARLILYAWLAMSLLPFSAHAAEYARTVRLGNCVIKPGTTVLKLVECAGEPITKTTAGVNLKTGQLDDVWLYKSTNRTVVIHISSEVVTKVEVKAE
ncbi:MAG: hypothetical protein ACREPJ_13615 [Rhodanobacteraceae bacterium]